MPTTSSFWASPEGSRVGLVGLFMPAPSGGADVKDGATTGRMRRSRLTPIEVVDVVVGQPRRPLGRSVFQALSLCLSWTTTQYSWTFLG